MCMSPSLLGKCDWSICKGVRSVIGAVFLFYVLRLQKSWREARYRAKRSALREAQCRRSKRSRCALAAASLAKPVFMRGSRGPTYRPPGCRRQFFLERSFLLIDFVEKFCEICRDHMLRREVSILHPRLMSSSDLNMTLPY